MIPTQARPSLFLALLPLFILIGFLSITVAFFMDDAISGPIQICLLIGAIAAIGVGQYYKVSYDKMLAGIVHNIGISMPSILILLVVGALAGSWLISGIIPAFIYYGLQILSPTYFLFAACIICIMVALATGTSWGTASTIGIALVGIGQSLGIHEGLVVGALISGAYFGDKMTPISDTTILAPAMAGTDVVTHIRYMAITNIPSIIITLLIYLVIGFTIEGESSTESIDAILTSLKSTFYISPILFLVPALVIFLIVRKIDALPALIIGVIGGIICALVFQQNILMGIFPSVSPVAKSSYMAIFQALSSDVDVVTGNPVVDELLTSGGMAGMMPTVWLIICAMVFGGAMDACGLLGRITEAIISVVKSSGSLILSAVASAFIFNVTAADQYLSIVIPGRMFAKVFRKRGLKPEALSRSLEDGGTVTSVLVPWNTCGAYHTGVYHVSAIAYAPFCFFNIINPLMSILFGYLNYKIARFTPEEMKQIDKEE